MPTSSVPRVGTSRGSGSGSREESRESSTIDRLIRRLRVSDPPDRYQRKATESLRAKLAVAAGVWVPASAREPVVISGEISGLGPLAYRDLVHGSRPPGVGRVAVVTADSGDAAGWMVAVDSADGPPFSEDQLAQLSRVASLVAAQRSNARVYTDLKDLLFGVIRALTSAIDAKDPYTSGHSERVARIAVRLAEALGMSPNQRGDLYLMGLLHDVGKIGVDDVVLKKTGPLTEEEFRLIQSHVRIGVHILSDLKKLHHLLPGVAHHHESLDGSGYPSGLAGDAIPLEARILAVADAFDAMSSNRPYRRRLTPAQIDENFRKGSGVQWDPNVVDALFACRADLDRIRQKGLGDSLNRAVDETLGRS
jgi:HD-GYP domain-containing protein (c-di-GMP phosphodiesterase class II)